MASFAMLFSKSSTHALVISSRIMSVESFPQNFLIHTLAVTVARFELSLLPSVICSNALPSVTAPVLGVSRFTSSSISFTCLGLILFHIPRSLRSSMRLCTFVSICSSMVFILFPDLPIYI